ncbi:CSLREA domain-containing protein [Kribbella qitaiheensis]|uniref:CSLREA domain-containing protein n=1 Tax=Kribbella qitaiheensis TaxID=1544730 RepID=A0A7G6X2B1_9ACTN|nr:choice-of-anchor Q domain-containing protein [Kribbella qitaiheensis]QNE20376.1 CSLREA domain-containing protein [Kribbella qitaiheensis]
MRRVVLSIVVAMIGALLFAIGQAGSAQAAPITVTTTADVVNGADGVTSLREAITTANAAGDATTITLAAAATYGLNLCGDDDTNATGDLDSTSAQPLTIEGSGSTIDQNCAGERVMNTLDSDGSLTLHELTLTGGDDLFGAALQHAGDATLDDTTVTGNAGGAGRVLESPLGGAILNLTGSNIHDNTGTGVALSLGQVHITDTSITNNTGRGVGLTDGALSVSGSTISGNGSDGVRTTGQGSGLFALTNTTVDNNGGTGVICSACGDLTVTGSTVTGNHPSGTSSGGGIQVLFDQDTPVDQPVVSVIDSTVSGNSKTGSGGGINTAIIENSSGPPPAQIIVTRSTISNNSASGAVDSQGGGIYAVTGEVRVDNSTVTGNSATAAGGGVYTLAHDVYLQHATVSGNTAGGVGRNVATNAGLHTFGSILAGGTGSSDCGIELLTTSTGYNLDGDGSCSLAGVGDHSNIGSPQLGALASNGGPTQTMLPLAASLANGAVPAAACTVLAVDQRGITRPQGTNCEAGSVEIAEVPPAAACTKTGTAGSDLLLGTAGADVLCGLGGDDLILGLGGNDILRGGNGKDLLIGGTGHNTLDGGPGQDLCIGVGDTKISC